MRIRTVRATVIAGTVAGYLGQWTSWQGTTSPNIVLAGKQTRSKPRRYGSRAVRTPQAIAGKPRADMICRPTRHMSHVATSLVAQLAPAARTNRWQIKSQIPWSGATSMLGNPNATQSNRPFFGAAAHRAIEHLLQSSTAHRPIFAMSLTILAQGKQGRSCPITAQQTLNYPGPRLRHSCVGACARAPCCWALRFCRGLQPKHRAHSSMGRCSLDCSTPRGIRS